MQGLQLQYTPRGTEADSPAATGLRAKDSQNTPYPSGSTNRGLTPRQRQESPERSPDRQTSSVRSQPPHQSSHGRAQSTPEEGGAPESEGKKQRRGGGKPSLNRKSSSQLGKEESPRSRPSRTTPRRHGGDGAALLTPPKRGLGNTTPLGAGESGKRDSHSSQHQAPITPGGTVGSDYSDSDDSSYSDTGTERC